ncbi:unnamed protein product [Eruca vesicaria subsp. sativa]|uniref:DEAD-box RNA helicase Q domain-containing protein n=1 Tax=Eruca vesicaria subsp. sativa TaxID=29727 RepID=A0ABC8KV49_ERUVS|nr:unnamed protein product [Eruca vesicaria subsp. sativa]CAH8362829.1 unnamed protein product [Eruca vesicaria subsp. sativa]
MGMNDKVLRSVYDYGFKKPSEIQQRAVLPILKGREVIAQAQTQSGTGKTSMIAISVCQLVNTSSRKIQVLVLSPSREFASQTEKTIESIGLHTNIRAYACIGGKSVGDVIKKLEISHDDSKRHGAVQGYSNPLDAC